jgi:hemolysin D
VHTIGGVVTPAQTPMAIVPSDSRLEIEAMVSNHDIGFVHAGDEVEIKVDTFDFTRYGLLQGRVLRISSDSIVRDVPSAKSTDKSASAGSATSEPKGQELTYAARISLDRTQMQVEDKMVNLSPGMALTAEIKTGSRRIIGYLLSPLMKYKEESLRER